MKYSRQRNIILDIMKKTYEHPTAEEVYIEAKKAHPKMGIATVYRNLNQLVEMGEINRISLGDGNDRYDGQLDEHYHLVCRCCGRLQDLKPDNKKMEAMRKLANEAFGLKAGNKAEFNTALMEGLCDKCKKMKKAV